MFRKTVLILLLLGVSYLVPGQPGDPGGDPEAPITGIEILLAIGGLFGVRHLMKKKK
jgi:hypothetical protein